MLENVSKFGKKLSKNQQKGINGGKSTSSRRGCCNPITSCCAPNPFFNGSNCQFTKSSICA